MQRELTYKELKRLPPGTEVVMYVFKHTGPVSMEGVIEKTPNSKVLRRPGGEAVPLRSSKHYHYALRE